MSEINFGVNNSQIFDKTYTATKPESSFYISESDLFPSKSKQSETLTDTSVDNEESYEELEAKLQEIEDNNGAILKTWDNIKNKTNLGASTEKCDKAIEQFKNGEITYEEALTEIEKYGAKQDSSLNLFSNIATGINAIVVTTLAVSAIVASGGTATPFIIAATGAATGAVTKAGVKLTDRATNEVEDDALCAKQIAKDALSGAVTGGIAAATAGTGGGAFNEGFKLTKNGKTLIAGGTKACMANSARTGAITGSISGSSNYLIECAFEEDKEFNAQDFAVETATNSLMGAGVGTVMGGVNGTLRSHNLLSSGGSITAESTAKDVAANSLCNAEYKIVTDGAKKLVA